jgi:hypothetical protein
MVLRTLTHAKSHRDDAQDMPWCVLHGNTEGVTRHSLFRIFHWPKINEERGWF